MKALILTNQKIWTNVKVFADKQMVKPKSICPDLSMREHKNPKIFKLPKSEVQYICKLPHKCGSSLKVVCERKEKHSEKKKKNLLPLL